MSTMRGFLGVLGVLFVGLLAGAIGFWAGVASGAGTVVAGSAAAPAYIWWGGPHLGGLVFGFLFLFLFIGLIAFAFGGRRRGPWGRGWYRGGWGYDPMANPSDPRHQWIADAHRRLHEEDARRAGQANGAGRANGAGQATNPAQPGSDLPPTPPSAA
jgi:hypothetical protein